MNCTPELRRVAVGMERGSTEYFCLADVVIDTFPSGGGHVLIEAMALGIPFISFETTICRSLIKRIGQ
jgi:predicted O-linked N-acetylglucosamine transferase (SPINDLY family)